MEQKKWRKLLFIFSGLFALLWFVIRVIPKPSRASYPCQRAAFPIASTFVLWLAGVTGVGTLIAAFKVFFSKHRLTAAVMLSAAITVIGCGITTDTVVQDASVESVVTTDGPIGIPRGVHPGRVVWAHDPDVTNWDKRNEQDLQYWSPESVHQDLLDQLFSNSLQKLAGTESDIEAWNALFSYTNSKRINTERPYKKGETIAVKINLNNQSNPYASEDKAIDASPHMINALLHQLVHILGASQTDIIVYDALRPISDPIVTACLSRFPDVRFIGGKGYPNSMDTDFEWTQSVINYSNKNIKPHGAAHIPLFLIEADYIINMAILKTHGSITGVTLCGKNHYGSIGSPDSLHSYTHPAKAGSYSPQVDIFGHKEIWGKTVLYMIDGLFASKGSSGCVARPKEWESFGNDWPSSLFLSQDIVAIDSVGIDFLAAEGRIRTLSDNYLHEAALADNPPSGTLYDPEADGRGMESLGVHEHWNNSEERVYTAIDFIQLLN